MTATIYCRNISISIPLLASILLRAVAAARLLTAARSGAAEVCADQVPNFASIGHLFGHGALATHCLLASLLFIDLSLANLGLKERSIYLEWLRTHGLLLFWDR
jgi:hypothetical protein